MMRTQRKKEIEMTSQAYTHGYNSSVNAYVGGPPYSADFNTLVEWYKGRLDGQRDNGVLVDESPKKMRSSLGIKLFEAIYN